MTTITNPAHLADAFVKVAEANHYLVGITAHYSADDLDAAEQILIDRDNAAGNADPSLNLALDLIEHERRSMLARARRSLLARASRGEREG